MDSVEVKKMNGFGYKTKEGKICMVRCFSCGKENYAMTVSSGICAWCGYDANREALKKPQGDA